MRKLAAVLAVAAVALLLLWSKRGGLGGRAERPAATPAEATAPEAPPVSAPPEAPAWRAVGEVNAPAGSVEILVDWDGDTRHLAAAEVRDGRYAADLPALAEMPRFLRRRGSVCATVVAPGFLPGRSEEVALEDREPGEIRLDVTLSRGAVVRGRAVDETGLPVPSAEVWLSPNELGDRAEADALGRFVLPLETAGAWWLCARSGDVGVAAEGPLQLPLSDHDAGDLVLRGPGRISGVAVYPDGTPVREMRLHAAPAELREARIGHYPDSPFDAAKEGAAPGGLRWGWTTTDGEGRFLIRGLRAGKYFFLEDRTKAVHETGTDVRIVIDLYRILVRVVDEGGAPVPGIGVSARCGDDAAAGSIDDLTVEPGDVWTIGIGDLDVVPAHVVVKVVPEKREYHAGLVARPVTGTGRVEVMLLDPRGRPMEPRVSLYAGTTVILLERPVNEQGRTREVPVGDYRLVVIPKDMLAPYLAVDTAVTVRPGAVTPVTLTARGGGRLRLTLKGGAPGDEIPDGQVTAHPAQGGDAVNFVPLHVREDGGYTIGGDWKWGEPTTGWLLLEPGPHELRVAVTGFEPVAVALHVLPEGVTDAEVTLVPAK